MQRYSKISLNRTTLRREETTNPLFYRNVSYPVIPASANDIYVITDFGDRFDTLANQFYGDSRFWWVIATSNPNAVSFDSLAPEPGTQLRIPSSPQSAMELYNKLNKGNASISSIASSNGGVGGAGGGY